jgi:fatty-acyl-CoA synthase
VDLETTIMGYPKVLEAAVIAVPHEKWQERPLACVVPKPGFAGQLMADEILDYLTPRVGKFDKKVVRERFKDWKASAP